jgi:hypothetical protein
VAAAAVLTKRGTPEQIDLYRSTRRPAKIEKRISGNLIFYKNNRKRQAAIANNVSKP